MSLRFAKGPDFPRNFVEKLRRLRLPQKEDLVPNKEIYQVYIDEGVEVIIYPRVIKSINAQDEIVYLCPTKEEPNWSYSYEQILSGFLFLIEDGPPQSDEEAPELDAETIQQLTKSFSEDVGEFFKIINDDLNLPLMNRKSAARLLVTIIKSWSIKFQLFCWPFEHSQDIPEEEWVFSYKSIITDCNRCEMVQKILDKLFGDRQEFEILPFVKTEDGNLYSFRFSDLIQFAEGNASQQY